MGLGSLGGARVWARLGVCLFFVNWLFVIELTISIVKKSNSTEHPQLGMFSMNLLKIQK
jgi:hypothetical protein